MVNQANAGDAGRRRGAATEQSTHSAVSSSRRLDGVILKCMRCFQGWGGSCKIFKSSKSSSSLMKYTKILVMKRLFYY